MKPIIELAVSKKSQSWWDSLTRQAQLEYVRNHKNSHYRDKIKSLKEDKTPEDYATLMKAKEDGVAIPPAWTNIVYHGKEGQKDTGIIATGIDSKGRKQRIETAAHRDAKIKEKHEKLREMAANFPKIQNKLKKDAANGDEAAKVLYLISKTGFRIGDKQGAGEVKTYGASSLEGQHISVNGDTVTFKFLGKKEIPQHHVVKDKLIASFFKHKKDNEKVFNVSVDTIRKAWKNYGGDKVHDIRSIVATNTAKKVVDVSEAKNQKELKAVIKRAAETAAKKLGNNPSEALKTYIDNAIFDSLVKQVA
ncbi:MAG: hypothetical protein WC967_09180 [Balneolaceae bacterium]